MLKISSRIFITSRSGVMGRGLERILTEGGFRNLIRRPSSGYDPLDPVSVLRFFRKNRPEFVILLPEKSGGIKINMERPAEFLRDNIRCETNIIEASRQSNVRKLVFVGASCAYPKNCAQPMKEEYLLTGPLEVTSEPYSIAIIAGMKMCLYYNSQYGSDFVPVIPATVYGPDDRFDSEDAHVIPSLLRKFHKAKIGHAASVSVWGSGTARREFIYIDDFADACLFVLKAGNFTGPVNIGFGRDVSIKELAALIKNIVGYKGRVRFDLNKPGGVRRKLLDSKRMASMGWNAATDLSSGISNTYRLSFPQK